MSPRSLALLALSLAIVGGAAVVGTSVAGDADEGASVLAARDTSTYPGLLTLAALRDADGTRAESALGLYPALEEPAALVFPADERIAAAARFARGRDDDVAFAVARVSGGVAGLGTARRFRSASLTKAMLLVAFLRRIARDGRDPTPGELSSLGFMIRVSDNSSADSIYRRTGDGGLRELARAAGMRDFEVDGDWANATLTPADEARFFLGLDGLVPARHRQLARYSLENVASFHSWGVPAAARPRWRVFFKGGWRPEGDGEAVHQGALLESGGRRFALAVMTRENVSQRYGEETIEGIARRLVAGGRPLPAAPRAPEDLAPLTALR